MSKFIKSLAVFMAGVPLLVSKTAQGSTSSELLQDAFKGLGAVSLRPLNFATENRFAGHRSHSSHSSHASHASHASHYSGSGGGYAAPRVPVAPTVPNYVAPTPVSPQPAAASTPGRASGLAPKEEASGVSAEGARNQSATLSTERPIKLTREEELKLQITRVQIKLHMLGLYQGAIDGIRNPATVIALKRFQMIKGLPQDGLMTTPTLNALGILAVQ